MEPMCGFEPQTYALRKRGPNSPNPSESLKSNSESPRGVEQISQEIAEKISVILQAARSACSANAPAAPSGAVGRSRPRGGSR